MLTEYEHPFLYQSKNQVCIPTLPLTHKVGNERRRMIKVVCNRCGNELTKFGAILLSPPDKKSKLRKYHICKDCFRLILTEFGIYPRS